MKTTTITNEKHLNDFKKGQFFLINMCHFLFIFNLCDVYKTKRLSLSFWALFFLLATKQQFWMIHCHSFPFFPLSFLMTPKRNLVICHLIVCLFHCQVQHLHLFFLCQVVSLRSHANSISQMMISQSSHSHLHFQPQSPVAWVENTMVQRREIGLNEIAGKQTGIKKHSNL